MFKEERHYYILKQLDEKKRVVSKELILTLQVSEDTIRRDLNELSKEKKLRKVHGGALPISFKLGG